METKSQNTQNIDSHVTTEEPGWKSKAQILFGQCKQDTADLSLLQLMLKDLIKTLKQENQKDIISDTFCIDVAAFVAAFSVSLEKRNIDLAMKINTLMDIGDFLALCGKFDSAHFCYDRIIQLDPNWDSGYISKSDAYRDAYELDKAIEYLKKAVDVNPLNSASYYNLAFYQKQKGLYREAHQTFLRFLSFAAPSSDNDQKFIKLANIWVRYLEKKMELFGEKRD